MCWSVATIRTIPPYSCVCRLQGDYGDNDGINTTKPHGTIVIHNVLHAPNPPDKAVFCTLSDSDQLRLLELYFTLHDSAGEVAAAQLSGLGQAARSTAVRNKFYSVLQAL